MFGKEYFFLLESVLRKIWNCICWDLRNPLLQRSLTFLNFRSISKRPYWSQTQSQAEIFTFLDEKKSLLDVGCGQSLVDEWKCEKIIFREVLSADENYFYIFWPLSDCPSPKSDSIYILNETIFSSRTVSNLTIQGLKPEIFRISKQLETGFHLY